MQLSFRPARESDAAEIAALRIAVAVDLTTRFGGGHWSSEPTERSVVRGISNTSRVLVAREGSRIVGTLRLAQKKPWAIDVKYFAPVKRALYLLDMAVLPAEQGRGIGRALLDEARKVAAAWPAQAIRLDAYDADAGAGPFYAKSGFREVGRVDYRGTLLIYYQQLLTP